MPRVASGRGAWCLGGGTATDTTAAVRTTAAAAAAVWTRVSSELRAEGHVDTSQSPVLGPVCSGRIRASASEVSAPDPEAWWPRRGKAGPQGPGAGAGTAGEGRGAEKVSNCHQETAHRSRTPRRHFQSQRKCRKTARRLRPQVPVYTLHPSPKLSLCPWRNAPGRDRRSRL